MGTLFIYIVKSALCLTLLYLPYTLLLRRERLHSLNRAVLLGILLVSFLLPSLHGTPFGSLSLSWHAAVSGRAYTLWADELRTAGDAPLLSDAGGGEGVAWWAVVPVLVYVAGVVVVLCVRLLQFIRLLRFIPKGCLWKERRADGITLYCHTGSLSPFSWMRSVVISEEDVAGEGESAVLWHEEAHVRYGHSYDTMLVLAAEILMWFNPLVWMLEADLRCIHEYQADDYVLRHGIEERRYQLYLIRKAVGSRLQSFANGLNQSTLKKRIAMMCNKKSNKWAACKSLYLLPAGVLALMSFTHPEFVNRVDDRLDEVSAVKVTDLSATVKAAVQKKSPGTAGISAAQADYVYNMAEELPRFPGGEMELMNFLCQNVKYPDSCQAKGIQGRVLLKLIVRKDGSISDKVEVVKSPHPDLTAEAKRVVSLMPKWTPAKQGGKPVSMYYVIPFMFRLK